MNNQAFSIELSTAELLWLSRLFNKIELPLLFPAEQIPNQQELQDGLTETRDHLLAKKWVTHSGKGSFKVDRLLFLLIDWLSQPELITSVNLTTRDEGSRILSLYAKQTHYLLVVPQGDQLGFTFLPNDRAASEFFGKQVSLPPSPSPSKQPVTMPSYQTADLIKLVWHSPVKAVEVWLAQGYQTNDCQQWANWLSDVSLMGLISKYDYDKQGISPISQSLFLQNADGFWTSSIVDQSSKTLMFKNVTTETVLEQLSITLRTEAT
jgi:hypothetical protein